MRTHTATFIVDSARTHYHKQAFKPKHAYNTHTYTHMLVAMLGVYGLHIAVGAPTVFTE